MNKGYTLLELLLVLLVLSAMMLLYLPFLSPPSLDQQLFIPRYVHLQSEALLTSEHRSFQETYGGDHDIEFAQNGYVQKAQTLSFNENRILVIELATGRLKKRFPDD